MFAAAARGEAFALATLTAHDGGPREHGAQMLITADAHWGFLSGGCIEADVALHARQVLASGQPENLIYGTGSPWADIRLPCGGRLDVLVERIEPSDKTLRQLRAGEAARRTLRYESDGQNRGCSAPGPEAPAVVASAGRVQKDFTPPQRLIVIGKDPIALALVTLGAQIGWRTTLVAPKGPETAPPLPIQYARHPSPAAALAEVGLDPWTAVALATHDFEFDHEALCASLSSDAGYVGVLGSRRKLDERRARLAQAGVVQTAIDKLHAPIGLPIGAKTPWEIAVATVAEIIAERRKFGEGAR